MKYLLIKDNIVVSRFGSSIPSYSFSLVSLMFFLRLLINFTSTNLCNYISSGMYNVYEQKITCR